VARRRDRKTAQRVERHLYRRFDTLVYRRALPQALQEASGVREFQRALDTNDLADARRMAHLLDEALAIAWRLAQADLDDVAAGRNTEGAASAKLMSPHDVVTYYHDRVDDHLNDALIERDRRLATAMELSRSAADDEDEDDDGDAWQVQPGAPELVQALARLLGGNGGGLSELIADAIGKAVKAHHAALQPAAPTVKPSPPIGELVTRYIADRTPSWRPSTLAQRRRELPSLAEFVGPTKPVGEIQTRDVDAWRQHLRDERELGDLAIRNYLAAARSFFAWAMDLEMIATNPATGAQRIATRTATVSPETARRDAFTDAELRALLAPDFADRYRTDRNREGHLVRVVWPLLTLLGGLRPNEIGYLRPEDVMTVEGHLCLRVTSYDTPDGAYKPKTRSSVRVVPVHSALVPARHAPG